MLLDFMLIEDDLISFDICSFPFSYLSPEKWQFICLVLVLYGDSVMAIDFFQ